MREDEYFIVGHWYEFRPTPEFRSFKGQSGITKAGFVTNPVKLCTSVEGKEFAGFDNSELVVFNWSKEFLHDVGTNPKGVQMKNENKTYKIGDEVWLKGTVQDTDLSSVHDLCIRTVGGNFDHAIRITGINIQDPPNQSEVIFDPSDSRVSDLITKMVLYSDNLTEWKQGILTNSHSLTDTSFPFHIQNIGDWKFIKPIPEPTVPTLTVQEAEALLRKLGSQVKIIEGGIQIKRKPEGTWKPLGDGVFEVGGRYRSKGGTEFTVVKIRTEEKSVLGWSQEDIDDDDDPWVTPCFGFFEVWLDGGVGVDGSVPEQTTLEQTK